MKRIFLALLIMALAATIFAIPPMWKPVSDGLLPVIGDSLGLIVSDGVDTDTIWVTVDSIYSATGDTAWSFSAESDPTLTDDYLVVIGDDATNVAVLEFNADGASGSIRYDSTTGRFMFLNGAGTVDFPMEADSGYFNGIIIGDANITEAELEILDGANVTTDELNILDGVTTDSFELNFVDGVTSAIQTQLDGKQASDADLDDLADGTLTGSKVSDADDDGTTKGVSTYNNTHFDADAGVVTIASVAGVTGADEDDVIAADLGGASANIANDGTIEWEDATDLDANGALIANSVKDNEIDYSAVTLTDFDYQTNWSIFYSDASGDVTELALGTDGYVFKSNGPADAPTWEVDEGTALTVHEDGGGGTEVTNVDLLNITTGLDVTDDGGGDAQIFLSWLSLHNIDQVPVAQTVSASAGKIPKVVNYGGGGDSLVWSDDQTGGGGAGDIDSVEAGDGLTGTSGAGDVFLDVGAGDGIDVATDAVSVDVSDLLGIGLTETSNNIDVDTATLRTTWDEMTTDAEADAAYEVQLDDEAGLYAVLSDVDSFVEWGQTAHDSFADYDANEHLDWTQYVGTIHAGNYTDNNTQLSEDDVEGYAISNAEYSSDWNSDFDDGASKNAIYDVLNDIDENDNGEIDLDADVVGVLPEANLPDATADGSGDQGVASFDSDDFDATGGVVSIDNTNFNMDDLSDGSTNAAITLTQETKLNGIETLADVTDGTNVNAAGAVMETDYNANTILGAHTDDTPIPIAIGNERMFGRLDGGQMAALSPSDVRGFLNVEDGADDGDGVYLPLAGGDVTGAVTFDDTIYVALDARIDGNLGVGGTAHATEQIVVYDTTGDATIAVHNYGQGGHAEFMLMNDSTGTKVYSRLYSDSTYQFLGPSNVAMWSISMDDLEDIPIIFGDSLGGDSATTLYRGVEHADSAFVTKKYVDDNGGGALTYFLEGDDLDTSTLAATNGNTEIRFEDAVFVDGNIRSFAHTMSDGIVYVNMTESSVVDSIARLYFGGTSGLLSYYNQEATDYFLFDDSVVFTSAIKVPTMIVGSDVIADDEIANYDWAGVSITGGYIADNAINSARIEDNTITVDDIGPNAVGASELAVGAVVLSGVDVTGTLTVQRGGTGLTSITNGGVMLGAGAAAVTAMSVLANGRIIVGDGITAPVSLHAFTGSTGDVRHEAGGLEADVSAYDGLVAITGGATAEVDSKSELEARIGSVDLALASGDVFSGDIDLDDTNDLIGVDSILGAHDYCEIGDSLYIGGVTNGYLMPPTKPTSGTGPWGLIIESATDSVAIWDPQGTFRSSLADSLGPIFAGTIATTGLGYYAAGDYLYVDVDQLVQADGYGYVDDDGTDPAHTSSIEMILNNGWEVEDMFYGFADDDTTIWEALKFNQSDSNYYMDTTVNINGKLITVSDIETTDGDHRTTNGDLVTSTGGVYANNGVITSDSMEANHGVFGTSLDVASMTVTSKIDIHDFTLLCGDSGYGGYSTTDNPTPGQQLTYSGGLTLTWEDGADSATVAQYAHVTDTASALRTWVATEMEDSLNEYSLLASPSFTGVVGLPDFTLVCGDSGAAAYDAADEPTTGQQLTFGGGDKLTWEDAGGGSGMDSAEVMTVVRDSTNLNSLLTIADDNDTTILAPVGNTFIGLDGTGVEVEGTLTVGGAVTAEGQLTAQAGMIGSSIAMSTNISTTSGNIMAANGYMSADSMEAEHASFGTSFNVVAGAVADSALSPRQKHHWIGTTIPFPNDYFDSDSTFPVWIETDYALTIDTIKVSCDADPTTEIDFRLMFADALVGRANADTIDVIATTNGAFEATTFDDATIAAAKCMYVLIYADPHADINYVTIDIGFTYD